MRCLIVDDNGDFLRAASALLESDGLTVVGVASTGAEAHRACRELKPDAVLLDIDLGAETGFEVARQLAGPASPHSPRVILVSAHSAQDFEELITEIPGVSFLAKERLSGAAVRARLAGANSSAGLRPQCDSR